MHRKEYVMANNISNYFAQAMVKLTERAGSVAFENTFQQIQKTVINRTNKEIGKLEDAYSAGSRERDALSKTAQKLHDDTVRIQRYIVDNQSNSKKLESIVSKITEMQAAFGADGDATDVTATDITKFNNLRAKLSEQVKNLYYLTHPDVVKPYSIIFLKDKLNAINKLTPVEGASTDAANKEISDFLGNLSSMAINAMDATRSTVSMASKLSLRYQAKMSDIQDTIQSKAINAQEKLTQEVENLKVDASNLLQAISISYDTQAYSSNYLSNAMSNGLQPPRDSILNIFS